mmetsp:Transcript_21531/g.65370  ORF Transcript_21531/g.65370 Transcript_21531/m.65370 type:complete len:313 (+) Transcript_21531:1419-2357(+)
MGAFGKATRCRIVAERHRSCSPYVTKMARGASTPLARSTVGFVPSPKQTMVPEPRSATSTGASRVVKATIDGSAAAVVAPCAALPLAGSRPLGAAAAVAVCQPPNSAFIPGDPNVADPHTAPPTSLLAYAEPSPASSSTLATARPTSPNPHITSASGDTCVVPSSPSSTAAVSPSRAAAPLVIPMSTSCASSAKSPSKGVAAIVTKTIAVSNAPNPTGSTFSFSASARTTNANSPPPESSNASRRPSAGGSLFGSSVRGTRVASPRVIALRATRQKAPVRTVGSCATARSTSKEEPASIKNTPSRIPVEEGC